MNLKDFEEKEAKRIEICLKLAGRGVEFVDIKSAYIDEGVMIGKGTVVYPCVVIEGNSKIGENCIIGQNSRIVDSVIADGCEVQSSQIIKSSVGAGTSVGPFAYMRPNSSVGAHCKVGDFVEIKNSTIGDGTKIAHLTYVGDADLGEDINLGCGVVFVNYDGTNKYRTSVGDHAFIGCNVNLIAPVNIAENAYIAAGSTITKDIPAGSLAVAREKEKIIEGWVERRGIWKKKSE